MTPSARQALIMDRLALNATASRRFSSVEWVGEIGSTNVELMARTRSGPRPSPMSGAVLIADLQTAGRGRLDRSWEAPAGSAFTGSFLSPLRITPEHLGLVPVAAGLAVVDALAAVGVPDRVARMKWPNDVIVPSAGDRKVCGILCEAADVSADGAVVVVGIGVNRQRPDAVQGLLAERAVWISDMVDGPAPSMEDLATALIGSVSARLGQLEDHPRSVVDDQRSTCDTIGREVRVELAHGSWTGIAVDVDDHGQLLVLRSGTDRAEAVMAADVVHLHPM